MKIDIESFLENLKSGKSKRTQDSLDKLNILLENHFNTGKNDYSIATIGRISSATGGITTVSIRNKTGEHFRLLIEAWAAKAHTTMKKPPVPQSRSLNVPTDMELLKQLTDPVQRAVFGQIIAEKNKLKAENRILKQNADIVIDMRPNTTASTVPLQKQGDLLLPIDIEALEDAVDETKMRQRGWSVSKYGAVKDEYERPLFKNGFVLAIQKILTHYK